MKCYWTRHGLWAISLALAQAAIANTGMDYRFDSIRARNAFGLKEPAPQPPAAAYVAPPPATTVKITGITSILDSKRAILYFQEQGKPAESRIMREGESFGVVKLQLIDVENRAVNILNNGLPMTLNMASDGLVVPVAPTHASHPSTASAPSRPATTSPGVVPAANKPTKLAGSTLQESPGLPPPQTSAGQQLRMQVEQARASLQASKGK